MLVGKNIEESRSLLSYTPGEVLDDVVFPFYKQGIISDLQWSEPLFWRLHSWSCSFCNYLLARDHMWGQGCRSTSTPRASPLYSALSLLHRLVLCLHHSKSGQQFRPGDDFHSQSFTQDCECWMWIVGNMDQVPAMVVLKWARHPISRQTSSSPDAQLLPQWPYPQWWVCQFSFHCLTTSSVQVSNTPPQRCRTWSSVPSPGPSSESCWSSAGGGS